MFNSHDPGLIKYGRQSMKRDDAMKPVAMFIAL